MGPTRGFLDSKLVNETPVDLSKSAQDLSREKTDWKNGAIYQLPGDLITAYFLLQEITSPSDQSILVDITSSDGVVIVLNGAPLLIHNNPTKTLNEHDVVLLTLKKGVNQILVKGFDNYQTLTSLGINYMIPQIVYQQKLPTVQMHGSSFVPIRWQVHDPVSPHRTLMLPNLLLSLKTL